MHKRLVSGMLPLLLLSACKSFTVPPSEPQMIDLVRQVEVPEYISYVSGSPGDYVREVNPQPDDICVVIAEFYIWEPGDRSDDVSRAIQETARILVNGVEIPKLDFAIEYADAVRYDEDGKLLGSHNAASIVCFQTSDLDLQSGDYIATIQFASTSGIGYSYSWVLTVP